MTIYIDGHARRTTDVSPGQIIQDDADALAFGSSGQHEGAVRRVRALRRRAHGGTGPRALHHRGAELGPIVNDPSGVNRRPQLRIVAPAASPEEAAAVVAALERFMRETAPPRAAVPAGGAGGWERAARHEATGTAPRTVGRCAAGRYRERSDRAELERIAALRSKLVHGVGSGRRHTGARQAHVAARRGDRVLAAVGERALGFNGFATRTANNTASLALDAGGRGAADRCALAAAYGRFSIETASICRRCGSCRTGRSWRVASGRTAGSARCTTLGTSATGSACGLRRKLRWSASTRYIAAVSSTAVLARRASGASRSCSRSRSGSSRLRTRGDHLRAARSVHRALGSTASRGARQAHRIWELRGSGGRGHVPRGTRGDDGGVAQGWEAALGALVVGARPRARRAARGDRASTSARARRDFRSG